MLYLLHCVESTAQYQISLPAPCCCPNLEHIGDLAIVSSVSQSHSWKPWTINWQWASGCAIHLVSSISVIPTGFAAAAVGYHRALPGPRLSVPLCQVLADRGHVCFLVHDCGHDNGPPLCHLLPSASVPWRQTFTLEHAYNGGLGPGPDTQFATGVKDRMLSIFVFEVWP